MRKLIFPLIVGLLVVTLGFVYKNYSQTQLITKTLSEKRSADIGASTEFVNLEATITSLKDRIRRQPADLKAKVELAMAYVQQARISANSHDNDALALKLIDEVLEKKPEDFDALCVHATLLLSQHHFSEGLAAAEKLIKLYPDAAFGYGLLCDAQVELGNYTAAVKATDRMMNIRPDLRVYARVSYLREIYGDTEGAKKALELAVKSGVAGLERTEWCRVQLGKLYETSGDLQKAEAAYQIALSTRPDYPFALAGLARLAMLRRDFVTAENLYEKAHASLAEPIFNTELSDVYRFQNQHVKSEKVLKEQILSMGGDHTTAEANHTHDNAQNPKHGHYADKEIAEAYLKLGDLAHAFEHAQTELRRRPENIEVNALMAWVLYKNGKFSEALPYAEKAFKTQYSEPSFLWKMAQVFEKNNQANRAEGLIKKAFAANPNLNTNLL
jgi:tetratricopeptide (TPR) repeat protein